jgi:protein SCO1/2
MGQYPLPLAFLFGIGLSCVAWSFAVQAEQHHHDHSAHQQMMQERSYTRSVHAYAVPDITLTDQYDQDVGLPRLLLSPGPVALNFIFTTCTTICPVMTATLAHMHSVLGSDGDGLRTVSISIDPEYDTPAVLKTYAARHGGAPGWHFLTGNAQQIVQVQKAFDAYTGSKANHRPITLFKGGGSQEWVRIDGLAGGSELAEEYQKLAVQ